MTVTLNPQMNGSRTRKSLAGQLDRLDSMLDGLDQGLAGAITDAVKDAVSTAVAETVRATLIEIVSNPSVVAMIRCAVAPLVPQPAANVAPVPDTEKRPNLFRRVGRGIASVCRGALAKIKAIGKAIITRTCDVKNGIVGGYRQINAMWRLRWPVVIALSVGAAVGVISYASEPWMSGILSGVGAMGTALGAQLAMWTRRIFAGFALR